MEKKPPTVKTIQWNKKRESKRFKTEEAAVIYLESDMTSLMAKVTNLSETGASLDVTSKGPMPKAGDTVSVILTLTNVNKSYEISATVAWVRQKKVGVKFMTKRELKD
jgi:hypothetical protein